MRVVREFNAKWPSDPTSLPVSDTNFYVYILPFIISFEEWQDSTWGAWVLTILWPVAIIVKNRSLPLPIFLIFFNCHKNLIFHGIGKGVISNWLCEWKMISLCLIVLQTTIQGFFIDFWFGETITFWHWLCPSHDL